MAARLDYCLAAFSIFLTAVLNPEFRSYSRGLIGDSGGTQGDAEAEGGEAKRRVAPEAERRPAKLGQDAPTAADLANLAAVP